MKVFKQWKVLRIVSSAPYLRAYVPDHPKANKHGYVQHHRVVAENKLGRLLRPDEVVHHINHNQKDNRPSNLEVYKSSAHFSLHKDERGENYTELTQLVCPQCLVSFTMRTSNYKVRKRQVRHGPFCSRKCSGLYVGQFR